MQGLGEVQGLGEDLLDSRRRRPLVRIGAVPHALPGVVQDFAAHWSCKAGVRLRLEDGPTSALVEKLLRGDLDAIVAPLTPEAGTSFTSAVKSRPLYTALLLLIPAVAMQFTSEVSWGPGDFVLAGVLLFGAGSVTVLGLRHVRGVGHRAALIVGVAFGLALVWAELAVGLFN